MAEPRAHRVRYALKWVATIAAVGLGVLLPANLLWRWRLSITPWITVRVYDGQLAFQVGDGSRPMPVGLFFEREVRPHIKFDAKFTPGGGGWGVQAPLVIPAGLCGAVAAMLWWRERSERRRLLVGHCRECGYDLGGLTAATCPECGCAVPDPGVGAIPKTA
jgi:hypothetical protein